ncbi:tetratricopeptide repeat protein [Actinomadura darangshiensis]|uniref:Tetratricopeptide repeat protein n=1 Tax=Actinomadura darangshiensis TaxID=705336 RepID=A0A4R5BAJ9_9ACTN|nr:tetratricopeptide repeat protein [Actinomadura darangshiensis]TDD83418.1 tetratricopeptide repeat protein [Actinomadura darangshiensis]
MSSWAERLEAAIELWRGPRDRDGAAAALREIVVAADGAVVAEASHVLGLVLAEGGDQDGARAAHRSVVAGGHPQWAQRSAIVLGTLLMDEDATALACRPLRIAASGADPQIAAMADLSLAHVLRELGDPAAAEQARRRALEGDPGVAELAAEMGGIRPPDDQDERDRAAWEAFESVEAVLESDEDEAIETVLTALNAMLSAGAPALCTRAAMRLYSIYAPLAEFGECRRVTEHAIAVGDPAERCRAEKLLAAALFDLGEPAEARDAYHRAAEDHRPEIRLDALIEESKLVRESGDEEGARRILRRVVDSGHPRYAVEARACLGQVLSEAGEVDGAVECWRAVLDAESEFSAGAVNFLGSLHYRLPDGDPRKAEIIELLGRAAELDDPDVSFKARLVIAQAGMAERGPDEELERAVDDCDAALERLRAGEVGAARTLLRRVTDAGLGEQSSRAASMLATLELGEGDLDQADELLEFVADGADITTGFAAALQRRLIGRGGGGRPHPVLTGLIDYQRLGREIGIARYEEAAREPDPAVSAPAKSALAQVYMWLGAPLSQVVELLDEAAGDGDPLALSHAAMLSWLLRSDDDAGEAAGLLRRAHAGGEPALAPWVAQAFGAAVEERSPDEALAAYERVSESGHPGLAVQAETAMVRILEDRGDLAAAAAMHERIAAGGGAQTVRHLWLLGFTRARMRDLDAARAAFAGVPEDDPELAADGVFARRLLDRDFPSAADALARVDGPGRPLAGALLVEAAHTWQGNGETAAAEAALSMAVEHDPADDGQRAALFLGALRDDEGDHAGAAEAWAAAAGGEDDHLALRGALELAQVRARLGDLDGAATARRRALEVADPDGADYPELLQETVKALLRAGRAGEARDVQAAVSGEGPHVDVLVGWNLYELDDHDAAARSFETAIACGAAEGFEAEAVARASVMLARITAGRGDAAEAVRLLRRALVLFDRRRGEGDPDAEWLAGEAAYDLGVHLASTGDGPGAREAYERAAADGPGLVAARARERLGVASPRERAFLAVEDGDRPRAVALFTEEYGEPLLAELHLALYEGEHEAAGAWLRRSAGTGHAEAAAGMVAGVAVDRLQRGMDGARELFEAVLECAPPAQVAGICENFGDTYEEQGDAAAAIEALERGSAVDHPAALRCLRRLVEALESLDGHPALEPAARRAAGSGDPETVGVGAWALADLLRVRGDHTGALPWYRTALGNARPESVPHIRALLGVTLHELGETEAAYAEFEAVLATDDHGMALMAGAQLGGWLLTDGSLARAVEAFGAAAAAGYRHPDPGEAHGEMHQEALNKLGAIAAHAGEEGDSALAVRALWLAAAGGAPADAVRIAEEYAAAADEAGDTAAARAYRGGAAAFPVDGPPGSPAAQHAERAAHAFGTGDHETAMRLFAQAAEAGEHARVLGFVQGAATLCTAEADVPTAHAYYGFGLGLAGGPAESLDRMRRARDDLPTARAGLTALYTALNSEDGVAGVLTELTGTDHYEAACRTVVAVAKARGKDDPQSARALLRPVAEMAPPEQAARAWDELGALADDPDEAVQAYERAAAIAHPAAHAALRHLARALYQQDRLTEAEAAAGRAVATGDPLTLAHGHRLRGLIRENRDDLDGAMREFRLGMAATEGIGEPALAGGLRLDLARALQRQGAPEAAAAEVRTVLAEAGTEQLRAKAHTYLGNIAALGGDLAAAAEAFAEVAAMDSGDDDVAEMAEAAANNLLGIANSAYGDGRHQLAVGALTLAARTSKRDLAAGVVEARAAELAEAGAHAEAMLYLDAGLAFPLEPDEEVRLAELCAAVGEPERAQDVYERLATHPDEAVQRLASAHLDGPPDSVGNPAALWLRADDLVDEGEYAEAREILVPLIEDGSPMIAQRARITLGRTYAEEDPARAGELYLAALEGPGEQSELSVEQAKMHLGALAKRRRDWPEALRWYQAVIDSGSSGNGPMAAAHLGELAYWEGDRDSAVRFYELCLATGTDDAELVGESAFRAGEIRFAQGDLAGAAAHLGRALESGHDGFAAQAQELLVKLNG